uniref:Uncharacterized protein n=1 Tax=Anguilla anguilla TaxID=7936 RepID=A0A0E9VLZ9_ANGAN
MTLSSQGISLYLVGMAFALILVIPELSFLVSKLSHLCL